MKKLIPVLLGASVLALSACADFSTPALVNGAQSAAQAYVSNPNADPATVAKVQAVQNSAQAVTAAAQALQQAAQAAQQAAKPAN